MSSAGTFMTERLVLRHPALADTMAVYEYASDPYVTRFMDWPTLHDSLAQGGSDSPLD
jgi:RimJ/RimL family protein N-acetyltransferase